MQRIRYFLTLALVPFLMNGCLEESDPAQERNSFVRVYNDSNFGAAYTPIDLVESTEGGYLVLASKRVPNSNYSGVYVLRVDATGRVTNELNSFDNQFVNPIGKMALVNGVFYFVCMRQNNQQAQLVSIGQTGDVISIVPLGFTYPVATAVDGSELLLLAYDNGNRVMQLARVAFSGTTVQGPNNFSIGVGDEIEEPIINHFLQGGRKFPFAVGRIPNGATFFNGFYNYSFSLVFGSTAPNTAAAGVAYGQRDDGGFSALEPLGGTNFAAARFNFGDNYLHPSVSIPGNSVSISTDLQGYALPELVPNANVKILRLTQPNKLLFASTSQSGQIVLLCYDASTKLLLGTRYLGFSNAYEVGSVAQTADGGIAVCGRTYVAGRFSRICLFKLSAEELNEMLN